MKSFRFKLIFILVLFSSLTRNVYSDQIFLGNIQSLDMYGYKNPIRMEYIEENEQISIMFRHGYNNDTEIQFSKNERNKLIRFIEKYKAWNIKASKKGDKFYKQIGTINIRGLWQISGTEWMADEQCTADVVFSSKTKTKHLFAISFREEWNGLKTTQYSGLKDKSPSGLYFTWSKTLILKKFISQKHIDKKIRQNAPKKIKKQNKKKYFETEYK